MTRGNFLRWENSPDTGNLPIEQHGYILAVSFAVPLDDTIYLKDEVPIRTSASFHDVLASVYLISFDQRTILCRAIGPV